MRLARAEACGEEGGEHEQVHSEDESLGELRAPVMACTAVLHGGSCGEVRQRHGVRRWPSWAEQWATAPALSMDGKSDEYLAGVANRCRILIKVQTSFRGPPRGYHTDAYNHVSLPFSSGSGEADHREADARRVARSRSSRMATHIRVGVNYNLALLGKLILSWDVIILIY